MTSLKQLFGVTLLVALSVGAGINTAHADGISRLVVGFPPGATGDRTARIVLPVLAESLGTSVIVENRVGAGGQLAVEYVKNAPPDGTILLQTIGSSMVIYPHTYKGLRYKPLEDFIPVGLVATAPSVLVVANNVPAQTLAQAIQLIKSKNPSYSNFGSPGAGSIFHFTGVLLAQSLKTEFTHVAYRGSAPLMQDLIGGQVAFGIAPQSDVLEYVRSGKVRALAMTGSNRSVQLPDVPTFVELGYPSLQSQETFGYYLPVKTPADTVAKYRAALKRIVADDGVRKKLIDSGLTVENGDPIALAARLKADYEQWGKTVKEIGFVAD